MRLITGKTMEEAYKNAVRDVIIFGEEVSPRGSKTKELAPATIVIEDARKLLTAPPSRKINPCFGIAETLWFLRGSDDLEEIAHYNSVWRHFEDCDNRGKLNGAYGKRLRNWNGIDQLEEVYKKLQKDSYSRQAVMILFDPERDNKIRCHGGYSKDIPCTSYFNFQIRNNKLNLHVTMRSNDLHKGFIYDAHNFMIIQNILAGWLGVEVGKYTHTASSLHIYESDELNMYDVLNDELYIYDSIEELPEIGLSLNEFNLALYNVNVVEEASRTMLTRERSIQEKVEIVSSCMEHVEAIENDFWRSAAACLLVYNMRKSRMPRRHWDPIIEKHIIPEYKDLFLNLSDLTRA